MKSKVLFVVQGEGRGHMTQAISLRQILEKNGFEICGAIVGTSERRTIPDFFHKQFSGIPVVRMQSPNFVTKNNRGINIGATVWRNFVRFGTYIKSANLLKQKVAEWNPEIIINFYEPIVGLYAKTTHKSKRPPIVCIAHQYLGEHPDFVFPKGHAMDRIFLKNYTSLTSSGAERILALSFSPMGYSGYEKLKVVPPLLRQEVKTLSVNKRGYYLCYLVNAGYRDDIENWHKKNPGICLHVFTDMETEKEFIEVHENLFFHKLSDTKFLEYMSGCNGLISTAGFESVCEAFYLDKPVFMVPVEGQFEQLCNGLDAQRAGVGIYDLKFDIGKFLDWLPNHKSQSKAFHQWESYAEKTFRQKFQRSARGKCSGRSAYLRTSSSLKRTLLLPILTYFPNMNRKRIAFVINPNSGSDKKTDRVKLIRSLINYSYDSEIILWKNISDRDEIFQNVSTGEFDIAVAVGGDGTVSQLAEVLCETDVALGIIPFGSGNGLARHLGIPLKPAAAMKLLETGVVKKIDRGRINNRSFFCTAGVGFDARIGKLFAESETRGFWTYGKMTLSEFRSYKAENYSIEIDGKKLERTAFLMTIANAGQYGNNAWIAPKANVADEILHFSILLPFRWWNMVGIAGKMFGKKLDTSRFLESFTGKKITITRKSEGAIHYDGEPDFMGTELIASIDSAALNVVVPNNFKG